MATRTPTRYMPRNRAELVACLIGLGDGRIVELKPDAVELLRRRFRVRTVKDARWLRARAKRAARAPWPTGRAKHAAARLGGHPQPAGDRVRKLSGTFRRPLDQTDPLSLAAQKQWSRQHPAKPEFVIERKSNVVLPFCYPTGQQSMTHNET